MMVVDDVAEAYRQAACGRVVAMLASKDDVPEQVVRRLTSALDQPTVVPKPVLRADTCVAMILVGVLVALVGRHVWKSVAPMLHDLVFAAETDDADTQDGDADGDEGEDVEEEEEDPTEYGARVGRRNAPAWW